MPNLTRTERRSAVLVVDDDPPSRLLMRGALERAGFDVREAADGALALRSFAQEPADIVLMDVEMPNMNGFAACTELRRLPQGQDTPVLMVTGHDDVESVHRAFEVGATDFLSKPINWTLLGYRVLYLLRGSRTYRALKEGQTRLAKAQQMARLGHWNWEVNEKRWYFSEEVCRLFGFVDGELPTTRDDMMRRVHAADGENVKQLFAAALRREERYEIEYRIVLPDGTTRVIAEKAEIDFNQGASPFQVEGTVQDITERREAEARIRYLAYIDGLTGLPNRQMFSEQVTHALRQARRNSRPLALLFLDIDNFKSINDSLGHTVGDDLLRQVADRLQRSVRASDYVGRPGTELSSPQVYRFGGDEFILLHVDLKHEHDASSVARRLMVELSEPFFLASRKFVLTVSVGIAVYPSDGDDAKTLLRNADSAMYQAKLKGRNTFEFYTESLTQASVERINMEAKLRRAIDQSELRLHFQPKIDVLSGMLTGAEALLRWNIPGEGAVSPARFIPLAEETGLIIPIGQWVLKEACRQMQAWNAIGMPPVTLAINVSARQFHHADLLKSVSRLLEDTGLSPRCLELELTESALMSDVSKAQLILREFRNLGVRMSIDDFGTGYSSLSRLKRFPLDALKIDQSFVRSLPADPDDSAIVAAILAMAHSLGLRVVAEGVETPAQFEFLRDHGCDEVQGYLFSPAISAPEFVQKLGGAGLGAWLPIFATSTSL